jgi:epoxyqueuosine reductase
VKAIYDQLAEHLNSSGISKWGIADLRGVHPISATYPQAISLALAYAYPYPDYDEPRYHEILVQKRGELDAIVDKLVTVLRGLGLRHELVPQAQQDQAALLAAFPHKLAATRAGLGWIGRNCLLVTPEFGPRVRLVTILLDADLPCGTPVNESRCGACRACVDACPYGYIKGAVWKPGATRETLFSALECSRKRETSIPSIGRKHACGLCLLCCPVGASCP